MSVYLLLFIILESFHPSCLFSERKKRKFSINVCIQLRYDMNCLLAYTYTRRIEGIRRYINKKKHMYNSKKVMLVYYFDVFSFSLTSCSFFRSLFQSCKPFGNAVSSSNEPK